MRVRRLAPLAVLAVAAACGGAVELPTAPSASVAQPTLIGDPPPPPVDTQFVAFASDGASTEGGTVLGRYFTNSSERIYWFALESSVAGDVIASPEARLQYNVSSGEAFGVGTLTFVRDGDDLVLDLRTVVLTRDQGYLVGTCPGDVLIDGRTVARCSITLASGGVK